MNQLTHEGVIPKVERGKYDLVQSVQGYIKYLKERTLSADLPGDEFEHRKRLLKARADLAEMEAAQLASQLVRTEVAEAAWAEVVSRIRQRLLAVAPKAAPVAAVETDPAVCYEIIESFIHEALAELAATEIVSNDESGPGATEGASDDSAAPEIEDIGMGGSMPEVIE